MDAVKGKSRAMLVALTVLLAGTACAEDTTGQPKLSGLGWTVVGPVRSVAKVFTDTDLEQKPKFLITAQSAAGAWAISEPLAGRADGAFELSMRVQRRSGGARVAIALLADVPANPEDITPLWHLGLTDGRSHKVELGLVAAATGTARLAIGAYGGEGQWQVDEIAIGEWTPPPQHAGPTAGLPAATSPRPLPPDWEPDGSLDGCWRSAGPEQEIVTAVNGLRISFPAEVTVDQGVRHGAIAFVTNRGEVEKELTVSIQGPPGIYMPTFTVPFAAGGTTFFRPPLQALVTGKHWIKLTFSSGGETALVPVMVNCERRYPLLGIALDWANAEPFLLGRGDPTQFLHIQVPPPLLNAQSTTRVVSASRRHVIMSLPLGHDLSVVSAVPDAEQGRRLLSLVGFYLPDAMRNSSGADIAAAVASSAEQIGANFSEAMFISPALPATASQKGLQLSPQLVEALEAGMAAPVSSIGIKLPAPPAAAVLTEQIDGRLRKHPCSFWAELDKQYDFYSLRQALNSRGAHLPMFLAELPTTITGDRRLDALVCSRLLISGFAQGCTAASFPPGLSPTLPLSSQDAAGVDRPVYAAIRELTRELAGAVPLRGLAGTEGFSGRSDEPIVYRSFLRESEGIVFMWNNSSTPRDVAVVLQALPIQMHILRLAYSGEFATRQFQGLFAFSKKARENHQQAVYVRVRPLEIVGLSLNLKNPHAAWLGQLVPRPAVKRDSGPTWPKRRDNPWVLD